MTKSHIIIIIGFIYCIVSFLYTDISFFNFSGNVTLLLCLVLLRISISGIQDTNISGNGGGLIHDNFLLRLVNGTVNVFIIVFMAFTLRGIIQLSSSNDAGGGIGLYLIGGTAFLMGLLKIGTYLYHWFRDTST